MNLYNIHHTFALPIRDSKTIGSRNFDRTLFELSFLRVHCSTSIKLNMVKYKMRIVRGMSGFWQINPSLPGYYYEFVCSLYSLTCQIPIMEIVIIELAIIELSKNSNTPPSHERCKPSFPYLQRIQLYFPTFSSQNRHSQVHKRI